MDPITAALVTAVSAGAVSALTETSKSALIDGYTKLKGLLAKKFGTESDVIQAVNAVEAKPDSAGRRATLEEEMITVKADQDQELLRAAQALIDLVQTLPEGSHSQQTAIGSYIAQADHGGKASVNIGRLPEH